MGNWVNVSWGTPNGEMPCVVLRKTDDEINVYPKFAAFDGNEWVDIDGERVDGVIAWDMAPTFDKGVARTLQKISECINKDSCEKTDCCYFTRLEELEALLGYMKF